jgi:hypothetical protein
MTEYVMIERCILHHHWRGPIRARYLTSLTLCGFVILYRLGLLAFIYFFPICRLWRCLEVLEVLPEAFALF